MRWGRGKEVHCALALAVGAAHTETVVGGLLGPGRSEGPAVSHAAGTMRCRLFHQCKRRHLPYKADPSLSGCKPEYEQVANQFNETENNMIQCS